MAEEVFNAIIVALQVFTLTLLFDLQKRVSRLEARINNCKEGPHR